MIHFKIFGIPVRVEPFFWVTLAIIGGAIGATTAAAILKVALFVLAGFVSILVHELGHAFTARKFGAYSAITLQAFGGYAAYSGVRLTRPQSFAVTAAGPLVQILLGAAVLSALPHLQSLSREALFFLLWLGVISIFWAVLNLLPILPLDGGQLLNTILGPQRIRTTLWVTIIASAIAGIGMFYYSHDWLFPLFLGIFAWQAFQALREIR